MGMMGKEMLLIGQVVGMMGDIWGMGNNGGILDFFLVEFCMENGEKGKEWGDWLGRFFG